MTNREFNPYKRYNIKLPSLMTVFVTVTIGLLIGFLGPFGSYEMPLLKRLVYWVLMIASGHLVYHGIGIIIKPIHNSKNSFLLVLIPSFVASIIYCFIVIYISGLFFDLPNDQILLLKWFFPQVFLLGLALNTLGFVFERSKNKISIHSANPVAGQVFLDRLPNKLGSQLICFCMEDHYLNAHTKLGSHMMLLRMKDALIELKGYRGMQVHRSWWISIDEVDKVKFESRKATLTLSNGLIVPVSQKYLSAVKEKGLI